MKIERVEGDDLPRLAEPLGCLSYDYIQRSDNFEVEEIPAYLPTGKGEHLYLLLRKKNRGTQEVLKIWEDNLPIKSRDIGYAGLKDHHATTTQWISIRGAKDDILPHLEIDGVEILEASYHTNKLKVGHLKGNRFRIRLDDVDESFFEMAKTILSQLEKTGVPNFFGRQRFGRNFQNRADGKAVLLGQKKTGRWRRKFLISAYQSALFNDVLAHRMREGLLQTVLEGDLMRKHESGGVFRCDDPEIDQKRMVDLEITPTGPMFGHKMDVPTGQPGEWEQALLAQEEISLDTFVPLGKQARGMRRPLCVLLSDVESQLDNGCLSLSFGLPPGAYASIVLHELGMAFS